MACVKQCLLNAMYVHWFPVLMCIQFIRSHCLTVCAVTSFKFRVVYHNAVCHILVLSCHLSDLSVTFLCCLVTFQICLSHFSVVLSPFRSVCHILDVSCHLSVLSVTFLCFLSRCLSPATVTL